MDGRVDPEGELDDALTWDGDEERGLEAPRRRRAALGGDDPAGADDELDGDVGSDVDGDDEPVGTTGGVLVVYGILAGVTLISMLTWISVIGASGVSFTDLLGELMYQFGEFLAIAGPGLWFAAVLVLGRDLAPRRRIRWHLVGLVVTAPWPILLGALA